MRTKRNDFRIMVTAMACLLVLFARGQEATSNDYRVSRIVAGFEFAHPSDWAVEQLKSNAQLRPASQSETEIYAIGVEDVTEPIRLDSSDMIEKIERDVQRNFPAMRRQGFPVRFTTVSGPALAFTFRGSAAPGNIYEGEVFVAVVNSQIAKLVAIGREGEVGARLEALFKVFRSLTPVQRSHARNGGAEAVASQSRAVASQSPAVQEWIRRVSGKKLVAFSSYSSGSSGGFSSQKEILVYANGSYSYSYSSSTSIYIPGASGGSTHEGGGKGTWRIVELNGIPIAEFTENGQTGQLTLAFQNGKVYLNGSGFHVQNM